MRLDTPEGNLQPSRRGVAASLFTMAYAPAALSACASPVTTGTDEVITADVSFTGAGGYALPAYLARPSNKRGRLPVVIVVNEIFGIHAYIKDVCHRLANEGFVALAPDYFDRAGDPSTLADYAQIRPIVDAATHEQVMGDTRGAVAWLREQSFADAGKIGITGFCWGGSVVWMSAALIPEIKAGVAWYGRLVAPPNSEPGRPWPYDVGALVHAPVLGLYGGSDQGILLADVESMRAALQAADNPTGSEIIVYPDAGHGFHADYRESYNEAAAQDGWTRALAWFRAHGLD
jgi:carboxymethylenebutenolidase